MTDKIEFDFEKLKSLVNYAKENGLDLLEIKYKDFYFKIEKKDKTNISLLPPQVNIAKEKEVNVKEIKPSVSFGKKEDNIKDANLKKIVAPLSGVFYRAPAPGAEPFVKEGDIVKKGDVLCIIEAMKVMNELQSDLDGKIKLIIPENGSVISEGDVLFLLE